MSPVAKVIQISPKGLCNFLRSFPPGQTMDMVGSRTFIHINVLQNCQYHLFGNRYIVPKFTPHLPLILSSHYLHSKNWCEIFIGNLAHLLWLHTFLKGPVLSLATLLFLIYTWWISWIFLSCLQDPSHVFSLLISLLRVLLYVYTCRRTRWSWLSKVDVCFLFLTRA